MRQWLPILMGCLIGLVNPVELTACPNCREAPGGTPGATSQEQTREATAFNRSIYLMAGMPFLLVGGMGLVFARRNKTA